MTWQSALGVYAFWAGLLFQAAEDGGAAEWIPSNLPGLGLAAVFIGLGVRFFLYLKKDVLDQQSRRITESSAERKALLQEIDQCRTTITEKDLQIRAVNKRNLQLERALILGGLDVPPEP